MSEKIVRSKNEPVFLRPIYFQPGELIFHTHGNLRLRRKMVQELMRWASDIVGKEWDNEIASSINIFTSPNIKDDVFDFDPIDKRDSKKYKSAYVKQAKLSASQLEHINEFRDVEGRYKSPARKMPPPFSLVFAKVESEKWPKLFTKSGEPEPEDIAKEQAKALNELLDIAILLDTKRGEAPVKLEVVSPNWLYSGGRVEDPGSTGGPGGRPFPVNDLITSEHKFAPLISKFSSSTKFMDLGTGNNQEELGNDVVVAILDTSHKKEDLDRYHNTWKSHPILNSLLGNSGSNGKLRLHPDPAVESFLPNLKIDGHDYDMTDHGLFVAGIINSIAPKAELHLYQVLNKYGLGDLRSLARALDKVLDEFQGKRLVVNLSLTMNMPLEKGHLKAKDDLGVGRAILKRRPWWLARLVSKVFNWLFNKELLCCCDSWFERQAHPFEYICDLVYALDSRVIAAAGNEAKNRKRPGALYPAAFDRVLGVGALAKDDGTVVAASYSNLADKPTNMGITAFGGEPGEKKGILGVFVGPFPDGIDNENGWAWWCGTSFATPVISGSTAAVLSRMPQGATTEDAIKVLFDAQGLTTNKKEDVFTVIQGPPSNSP